MRFKLLFRSFILFICARNALIRCCFASSSRCFCNFCISSQRFCRSSGKQPKNGSFTSDHLSSNGYIRPNAYCTSKPKFASLDIGLITSAASAAFNVEYKSFVLAIGATVAAGQRCRRDTICLFSLSNRTSRTPRSNTNNNHEWSSQKKKKQKKPKNNTYACDI